MPVLFWVTFLIQVLINIIISWLCISIHLAQVRIDQEDWVLVRESLAHCVATIPDLRARSNDHRVMLLYMPVLFWVTYSSNSTLRRSLLETTASTPTKHHNHHLPKHAAARAQPSREHDVPQQNEGNHAACWHGHASRNEISKTKWRWMTQWNGSVTTIIQIQTRLTSHR